MDDDEMTPEARALESIAYQIRNLGNGDAATPMGGLEALGKVMSEATTSGASEIASSLSDVASAIDRLASSAEGLLSYLRSAQRRGQP